MRWLRNALDDLLFLAIAAVYFWREDRDRRCSN